MIKHIKILFFTVILMLIHPLYADVIIGNGNIENLNSAVIKDINCQKYTILTGGLLSTANGGVLREVTTLEINGTWDFGSGQIVELAAWINNGTVAIKPTQTGTTPNLLFTTLCASISVLGTSDTDGDGISDADEGDNAVALGHGITLDQDGDGIYNFLDDDSDNDGISDLIEGGNNIDSDGDGIPDYLDQASATPPVTSNDTVTNQPAGTAVTVNILANDSSANPVDPSTVSLDFSAIPNSFGTDTDNDGDIDTVVVLHEGTWSVNPTSGEVTFTPETGFIGDPTPISYTVRDNIGLLSVAANIIIYYSYGVHSVDDTLYANKGETVTISVLDNDSSGKPFNLSSILIIDPITNIGDTVLLVPNEGIWAVDTNSGEIVFVPNVGFTSNPTPIIYTVEDSDGALSNQAHVTVIYQVVPVVTPRPTPIPIPKPHSDAYEEAISHAEHVSNILDDMPISDIVDSIAGDFFSFRAPLSGLYLFFTDVNSYTYGEIYDRNQVRLARNENKSLHNFTLRQTLRRGELYYIRVLADSSHTYMLHSNFIPIESFVTRFYVDMLGRNPEPNGLQYWVDLLADGVISGVEMAQGFGDSTEFTNRNLSDNDYLITLYQTFFDRTPDTAGYLYWLDKLQNGTSRSEVLEGFANSKEFKEMTSLYGIKHVSTPTEKFVIRLYKIGLLRYPDGAGLRYWVNGLTQGQFNARIAVSGFVFSDEFTNQNLDNTQYVTTLYNMLFNRAPDSNGLNNWVNKLNNGTSREVVLDGFLNSQEFIDLAKTYGLRRK